MMRVAILHFHLRAGGVTRVIEMACTALLRQGCDVLVISGEPLPPGCRLPAERVAVAPELRYDGADVERLRAEVEAAMHARWGGPADVMHLHNHSLGKNFALPPNARHWAGEGRALVLHYHDFAENGRPLNYRKLLGALGGPEGLSRCLYPVGPRVGYAFLTEADFAMLRRAGLTSGGWMLPNPVALPQVGEKIPAADLGAERVIVYPTRAIRRKNIGEALLWAAWAGEGEKIVLTAAPAGGPDVARHARWRAVAEDLGLPVFFDAQTVLGRPTVDFLYSADACLTTSVTEGFGMAFLEPWPAGRAVTGRDLPGVTADFRAAGVVFENLYERLDVPTAALDRGAVEAEIAAQVSATCAAYGVAEEPGFFAAARAAVFRGGMVDFGRLSEARQEDVLRAAARSGERRALPVATGAIAANREVIAREFSLDRYGERMRAIYENLLAAEAGSIETLDASRVLAENLHFEDFFALRG